MVSVYTDSDCHNLVATGTSGELSTSGIPVPVPDNSSINLYARDSVGSQNSGCSSQPLNYLESNPPLVGTRSTSN